MSQIHQIDQNRPDSQDSFLTNFFINVLCSKIEQNQREQEKMEKAYFPKVIEDITQCLRVGIDI